MSAKLQKRCFLYKSVERKYESIGRLLGAFQTSEKGQGLFWLGRELVVWPSSARSRKRSHPYTEHRNGPYRAGRRASHGRVFSLLGEAGLVNYPSNPMAGPALTLLNY